jgi:hypothetical protein
MQVGQFHYLPLTPAFFPILVGIFLVVRVLIKLEALRHARMRLGMSSSAGRPLR